MSQPDFLARLSAILGRYLAEDAAPGEHLSLLRWQIGQRHALGSRDTFPGHVTTSAILLAPDGGETLLVAHKRIGRWLQPGGHYEAAPCFWHSARREAEEETGIAGLELHPWHEGHDRPFVIDSHDVPGNPLRNEPPHVHHDLQFLLTAPRAGRIVAQLDEVEAAVWHPVSALAAVSPKAAHRLQALRMTRRE